MRMPARTGTGGRAGSPRATQVTASARTSRSTRNFTTYHLRPARLSRPFVHAAGVPVRTSRRYSGAPTVLRCSDAGGVMTLVHASPAWYLLSGSGSCPCQGWLSEGLHGAWRSGRARGRSGVLGSLRGRRCCGRCGPNHVGAGRQGWPWCGRDVDERLRPRRRLCTTGCRSQGVHLLAPVGPPRHTAPPQPSTRPVDKCRGGRPERSASSPLSTGLCTSRGCHSCGPGGMSRRGEARPQGLRHWTNMRHTAVDEVWTTAGQPSVRLLLDPVRQLGHLVVDGPPLRHELADLLVGMHDRRVVPAPELLPDLRQ